MKKRIPYLGKRLAASLLAISMTASLLPSVQLVKAANGVTITYTFEGSHKNKAGYAQGTIKVSSDSSEAYHLYWADDTKALDGYYEINSKLKDNLTSILGGKSFEGTGFRSNSSNSFTFEEHTAIPAGATKIIAVTDSGRKTVADAAGVYEIPAKKQLGAASGKLLYSFTSYSDVHISSGSFWTKSKDRLSKGVDYATSKNADFINITGDIVTSPDQKEWDEYKRRTSKFGGKLWECIGNHDEKNASLFIKNALTSDSDAHYQNNKAYYYTIEPKTGDVFIYLALEGSTSDSSKAFSSEQMKWFKGLLDQYYSSGVNIFVSEHSPYENWSIGEYRYGKKLYSAHLKSGGNTDTFVNYLSQYKNLIWMSGHTHQDFSISTNYSNENGTACNMIHNPGLGGTTYGYNKSAEDKISNASSQTYHSPKKIMQGKQDGAGYHSQGYYVETYENEIIYYGSDVENKTIYPEYCYIMEGSRSANSSISSPEKTLAPTKTPSSSDTVISDQTDGQNYYFVNKEKWSEVACYAWSSTDKNAKNGAWPGVQLSKVGTSDGYDVYKVNLGAKGTYDSIIFNDNQKSGKQTIDISLSSYSNNCFEPGSKSSKKYEVKNSNYNDPTIVAKATASPSPKVTATPKPTNTPKPEETLAPTKNPDAFNSTPSPTAVPTATPPTVGTSFFDQGTNGVYTITKTTAMGGNVTYRLPVNSKTSSITIPSQIMKDNKIYNVTAIAKNAFKNNKSVKKIVIGKKVTSIGAYAFKSCKKLTTVKISGSNFSKVGKQAFAGLPKKIKFLVPKSKKSSYKKLLKKAGLHSKAKF